MIQEAANAEHIYVGKRAGSAATPPSLTRNHAGKHSSAQNVHTHATGTYNDTRQLRSQLRTQLKSTAVIPLKTQLSHRSGHSCRTVGDTAVTPLKTQLSHH